jgi:hypothetical protein
LLKGIGVNSRMADDKTGSAMPYDRERVWQLEAQLRQARQKLRMRKAKQIPAKLRLKLST